MSCVPTAQKKLRESQFFFQHLLDEQRKAPHLRFEEFGFYLSAFLSASRAVLEQFHGNKQPQKHKDWWKKWKQNLSAQDRVFLNFMIKQRDLEVHEARSTTMPSVELKPAHELPLSSQSHPAYYAPSWSGPPEIPPPKVGVMAHHFQQGGTVVEVRDTCRRYLDLLKKAVADFDSGNPPTS